MKLSKWTRGPIVLATLLLAGATAGIGQTQSASEPSPPASPKPTTISSGTAGADGAPTVESVAVLELEAIDASKGQAAATTDRLREELLRIGKFKLVDRDQMDQVFKEQAFQQAMCTSVDCAASAGKVLGVKKILAGRLTRLDDTHWVLTASLLEVETAQIIHAETLRYEGTFFAFLGAGIQEISTRLSGGEASSGPRVENAPLPPGVRMPERQLPPAPGAKP